MFIYLKHASAYERIIEAIKGSDAEKKLAPSFITRFFGFFPSFQEAATDAILDLIEDEDPQVSLQKNIMGASTIFLASLIGLLLLLSCQREQDLAFKRGLLLVDNPELIVKCLIFLFFFLLDSKTCY